MPPLFFWLICLNVRWSITTIALCNYFTKTELVILKSFVHVNALVLENIGCYRPSLDQRIRLFFFLTLSHRSRATWGWVKIGSIFIFMWTVPLIVLHTLQMDFTKSKVLLVFNDLFSAVRFPHYFNKKAEFMMIFFVTGCANAQNSYGCYRGGRKAQLVGSQAAVWVFCAPLGDPLACQAPNKHHVCVLCRVSHGVCWDMIRRRRAGNELMLSCPWMQNYQSAFPAM